MMDHFIVDFERFSTGIYGVNYTFSSTYQRGR